MAAQASVSPEELSTRYRALYSGAVADTLDILGLHDQVLPHCITPASPDMVVAGPAFTVQGYPVVDLNSDDSAVRIRMLEDMMPRTVAVWAAGGHRDSAVWGELMAHASRERGSTGAVVDGGLRDSRLVSDMRFPVFSRFRSAAGPIGRWELREWQVPVRIGRTVVRSGDFIFGDVDGVVVVPREYALEVLSRTEEMVKRESGIRAELAKGAAVSEVYRRYGKL